MNRPKLLFRETFLEYFLLLISKTESSFTVAANVIIVNIKNVLLSSTFYLFAPENLLFVTCAYFLLLVKHKDVVNHTALKSFL